jgi:hypothetical protein
MMPAISLVCIFLTAGAPTSAPQANAAREAAAQALIEFRLGTLLDPARRTFLVDAGPVMRPVPAWLKNPVTLPPRAGLEPPAPPEPAGRPTRPHLYAEPIPLSDVVLVGLDLPKAPKLPAGELVKQWAPSSNQPPPLPIFGHYLKDRTSLADPSLEASTGMTRLPQSPARIGEVPFQPWNLPDPFENGTAIRLRDPWAENPLPPLLPNSPTRK